MTKIQNHNYNNIALAEAAKAIDSINFDLEFVTFEGKTYLAGIDADDFWGYPETTYVKAQSALAQLFAFFKEGDVNEAWGYTGFISQHLENLAPFLEEKSEEEIEKAIDEAFHYDDVQYGFKFHSIEEMLEELEVKAEEFLKEEIAEKLDYFLED